MRAKTVMFGGMPPDSTSTLQLAPAAPQQWPEALLLAFASLPNGERGEKVEATITAARRGELSLNGLLTARRDGKLRGALLAQPMPGKTALLWPPQLADEEPEVAAQQLLAHTVDWLRRQGVCMAQGLLPHENEVDAQRLTAAGFLHAADLIFMYYPIAAEKLPTATTELTFEPFAATEYDRLSALIQKTYEDSLDCPAIDALRKIDDVLEGYRQTGVFHAARWLFVQRAGRDVGCLLLADHPAHAQWELVYMGLVPEARGKSYGRQIVRHAQSLAAAAERRALLLAVDAANDPAIGMYTAAGFIELFQRRVFLLGL